MCFIFHKWSKWQEYKSGNIVRVSDNSVLGFWMVQKRKCQDCGKEELSIEKVENVMPQGYY